MKLKKIQILFAMISMISFGCEEPKEAFYRKEMQSGDVYRLPIIEPYQLITSYCCKSWSFYGLDSANKFTNEISVDSLNYRNGVILFYSTDSWAGWVVFDIKKKEKKIFEKRYNEFLEYLSTRKITNKLYSAEYAYIQWRESKKLPWQ